MLNDLLIYFVHQSFGRYPQLCQTLGVLAGLLPGEPPRMPCRQEAAHSAPLCFLPEETDVVLTPGTGVFTEKADDSKL